MKWRVEEDMIFNEQDVNVATVGNEYNMQEGITTDAQQDEWLKIIAAAPDMLRELQIAQEIVRALAQRGSHFAEEALVRINATINKARGIK